MNIFRKALNQFGMDITPVKKSKPVQKPMVMTSNAHEWSDGQDSYSMDKSVELFRNTKQDNYNLNKDLYKKGVIDVNSRVLLLPPWALFERFYDTFPAVKSGVNFISSMIAATPIHIKDKHGYENILLQERFEKRFGSLKTVATSMAMQFITFGVVIDVKIEGVDHKGKKKEKFILIPASETSDYYIDRRSLEVQSFAWAYNDVVYYERIDKSKNPDEFYFAKMPQLSNQFIGSSKFDACATIIDAMFRDDENYQLFMKNGGYPVVIALIAGGEEINRAEVESTFTALRDPSQRFKVPVINNAVTEEGGPAIQFAKFDPKIGERYSKDEKDQMYGFIYETLGIQRSLVGVGSLDVLNDSQYETALMLTKMNGADPISNMIKETINNYRLPLGLEIMQKEGLLDDIKIKDEDGVERKANPDDFYVDYSQLRVETPSKRADMALKWIDKGAMSVSEGKKWGLGYTERDINDDDKRYSIDSKKEIIKEGEITEKRINPVVGGYEVTSQEEIADYHTESSDDTTIKNKIKPETTEKLTDKPDIDGEKLKAEIDHESFLLSNSSKKKSRTKAFIEIKQKSDGEELSRVPELVKMGVAKAVESDIRKALEDQYTSIEYNKLISNSLIKGLQKDYYETELAFKSGEISRTYWDSKKKQIESQLNFIIMDWFRINKINPLSDFFPQTSFMKNLLFFGQLGYSEVESASLELQDRQLSTQELIEVQAGVNNWIYERMSNLLNSDYVSPEVFEYGIQPRYDGDLDITSQNAIIQAIILALLKNPEASNEEIINYIEGRLNLSAKTRAKIINEDNIAKIFAVGSIVAGKILGGKRKKWLRTLSEDPRLNHLSTVGKIVGFDEFFEHQDGSLEYWSNVSVNCKCGIKILFD